MSRWETVSRQEKSQGGEGKSAAPMRLARAHWRQYVKNESGLRMLMAWLEGHWAGLPAGDVQRMPGVFLLVDGKIRPTVIDWFPTGRITWGWPRRHRILSRGWDLRRVARLPQDMELHCRRRTRLMTV